MAYRICWSPRRRVYLWDMIRGLVDSSEAFRPWGYRAIFGPHATPELLVYDQGGDAGHAEGVAIEGVTQIGIQPKGQRAWHVAEDVRQTVRSERGKTEGIIGTLKTAKYGFNKAQGTSVADAGDGRFPVSPPQSEQTDARSGAGQQVRRKDIGAGKNPQVQLPERDKRRPRGPHCLKEFCDTF